MSFGLDSVYLTAIVELLALGAHAAVIISVILTRRREPAATLAWVLFVAFVPIVGALAYLLLGRTRMRRTVRRLTLAEAQVHEVLARHDVRGRLSERRGELTDARTHAQVRLGAALASSPASSGNAARVLHDAAATYPEILRAIDEARDHIHVEFYIVQPDAVGTTLRDHLVRKAASGVEVRIICDAIGSAALPSRFWDPLRAAGGHAAFFGPLSLGKLISRLRRRDRVDFRNHRKIVVVDGRVGFTGGINVGREYLGLDPSIGHWRDTHVRIDGPAVLSLQQTFLQDWLVCTEETLDDIRYFPNAPPAGDCLVQVIDSGPDHAWSSMELYYAQAIAFACDRVWITNPYFVPSHVIESALITAALRGVDVRLLLPTKSDGWLVSLASRSYYGDLLHAGVRIFEYERGFVHAKTMVVDEWVVTIGSANMDMRSFNLNFELNAFIFGCELCRIVGAQFAVDLLAAREVTLEAAREVGIGRRLLHALARLLSPLL